MSSFIATFTNLCAKESLTIKDMVVMFFFNHYCLPFVVRVIWVGFVFIAAALCLCLFLPGGFIDQITKGKISRFLKK